MYIKNSYYDLVKSVIPDINLPKVKQDFDGPYQIINHFSLR